MAVDMFLKIDGVEGESQSSKHKGEIEILSFSWGLSQTAGQPGSGGGAGKVNAQDFSIVKLLDTATPQLIELACRGQHVGSALLTLARSGGKEQQEYLKIKLTDILVSSYSTGGSSQGIPAEQVSFSFQDIEVSAAEVRPDGSISGWKESTSCQFHGKA
jgi:type VI secretion system secreted protein Hcp